MSIITLTTDFGQKDGFSGTLKGVIWKICPRAEIADISHEITPQNILEGALILWKSYRYFPERSIHLAVVDPGVGTQRRPIVIRTGHYYFVGPDNGIFTPVLEDAEQSNWKVEICHLKNVGFFLPNVSSTFHGRDIFASVAAHLANGVPLTDLGPFIDDPIRILLPKPERTDYGWRIHVVAVDLFGNLQTDLPVEWIKDRGNAIVKFRRHEVKGVIDTYGAGTPGKMIALADSEGRLEVAAVNGSAAQVTSAKVGDIIEVIE